MAQVVNFVKAKYPSFYNAVSTHVDTKVVREIFANDLPQIEADVIAFAKAKGIALPNIHLA